MQVERKAFGPVLIVEDDAILAAALAGCLEDAGATIVQSCSSAAEAMTALGELKPDVLVLDVSLADRDDGWGIAELARELAQRPLTIVFSTGSPEAIPPEVAQLGIVMEKPYAPEALAALIAEHAASPGLIGRLRRRLAS
jgi:CheY-like chemotaxis protein